MDGGPTATVAPDADTGREAATRPRRRPARSPAPRASGRPAPRRADRRLPRRLLALPAPLQPGDQLLRVETRSAQPFTFIGLEQLPGPRRRPGLLAGDRSTRRSWSGWASPSRCVLGTALALFFDLHLRGIVVRARRPHPADAAHARSWSGLMWRALLNPDWGMVNWALGELGLPQPLWLGRSDDRALHARRSSTRGSGRRSSWSSCSRGSRRCRATCSRHRRSTAPAAGRRSRAITLPLLAPAIVFAGDLPGDRRVPLVRHRLRADVRRAGPTSRRP